MRLLRADAGNDVFSELERQWSEQCDNLGESYDEFSSVHIEHARGIVGGKLNTDRLAIYALTGESGAIECMAHLNVAPLPKTIGMTLRIRSILLAPKYDYGDIVPEKLAYLASILFDQAMYVASGKEDERMAASHVKVHMTGLGDRAMFGSVFGALEDVEYLSNVAVRGNWLEMTINDSLSAAV